MFLNTNFTHRFVYGANYMNHKGTFVFCEKLIINLKNYPGYKSIEHTHTHTSHPLGKMWYIHAYIYEICVPIHA